MPIHAPKIGVFVGFYPQNGEQYERDPQNAHTWAAVWTDERTIDTTNERTNKKANDRIAKIHVNLGEEMRQYPSPIHTMVNYSQ